MNDYDWMRWEGHGPVTEVAVPSIYRQENIVEMAGGPPPRENVIEVQAGGILHYHSGNSGNISYVYCSNREHEHHPKWSKAATVVSTATQTSAVEMETTSKSSLSMHEHNARMGTGPEISEEGEVVQDKTLSDSATMPSLLSDNAGDATNLDDKTG